MSGDPACSDPACAYRAESEAGHIDQDRLAKALTVVFPHGDEDTLGGSPTDLARAIAREYALLSLAHALAAVR